MAAAAVQFDVKGIRELRKKFRTIKEQAQKRKIRAAVNRGAKIALEASKEAVPVLTGNLRRSLKVKSLRIKKDGIIASKVIPGTREELGIPRDAKYYYPAAIEYGRRKPGGGRVPAKSFLREPLFRKKDEIVDAVRKHLVRMVNSFAKR